MMYGTNPVFDYRFDSRVGAYGALAAAELVTEKVGPTECLNIFIYFTIVSILWDL